MPKLIMMTGPTSTRQIPLQGPETTVGRAPLNNIVIDGERVSRFHAVLRVEPAFVTIVDLNSRNGTFVNGVRVESQALANGDSIRIGDCDIRFLASEQEFTQVEALRLMTIPGLLVDLEPRTGSAGRSSSRR